MILMRNWRKHVVILIAYTIVVIVMTYPLVLNFGTAIPGVEGDATSFVWALGWMKTALMDLRVNPFHTDYVFYPLGGATQLMWAVSLIAFVSIPFQYLLGLIATHNLFYLAATVLTAYGMYVLAEEILASDKLLRSVPNDKIDAGVLPPLQTLLVVQFVLEARRRAARRSPLAPFVAGSVFAFAPLRLGYGLSFFNLFNTQLIPFYVLFLIRATRERTWRDAIVAGILLGLNAYIDFQIAAFLILFTALYAAFVFLTEWMQSNPKDTKAQREKQLVISRREISRSARNDSFSRMNNILRALVPLWSITTLTSLLVAAPMLAIVANDFATEGGNYIRVFPIKYSTDRSYDLVSYFVPNAWNTFYSFVPKIPGVNGGVNANDGSALSPDRQPFVGYIVLALAIFATIAQWKRARLWSIAAIVFALLSLGPSLHVLANDTGIPLPYLALHEIPIVNHIRIPMRYGIMVMFALAILAAIAVTEIQKRLTHQVPSLTQPATRNTSYALRFTLLFLPIFILLEFANLPYPTQAISIPKIYSNIAHTPGDFTVLEIPSFNWRGAAATEAYQVVHGKRILRAYTNRIAPGPAEYFGYRSTPIVVRSLRVLEGYEKGPLAPEDIAEDKSVRDDVVRFFDLRYAVVHRNFLKSDQVDAIDLYLRDVLNAKKVSDDGDTLAYEIPQAQIASQKLTIDLRDASRIGQMYAGRGWQFEYPQADYEGQFKFVWASGAASEIYFPSLSLRAERRLAGEARNPQRPADADAASSRDPSTPASTSSASAQDALLAMTNRTMTIHAYAESPQRVTVWLNGERISEMMLTSEWKDYRIDLPARVVRPGMNRVELRYDSELKDTIGVTTITIE
ncbi:MAG: hypothetical protein HZB51_32205 [Chloroflexi bacterium]|nr:hypothetical protein [Chloroflexota bacterium]